MIARKSTSETIVKSKPPTTEEFVAIAMRALDLMGGPEKAHAQIQAEFNAKKARWNQDTLAIGRILRAHLYLEYYLTERLQHDNPGLGDLDEARLSFNQKLALIRADNQPMKSVLQGIRHLNKVRNKLAHNLSIVVTKADADVFLSVPVFKALRDTVAVQTKTSPSNDPLDVLERFAEFSAALLHEEPSTFDRALKQATAEWKATEAGISAPD